MPLGSSLALQHCRVFLPNALLPRNFTDSIRHTLVAISTTGARERAGSWLKDNKIPNSEIIKIYHSWEEMLETGDFDAVYILTPHPLQCRHVAKALACNQNVLIEKPATMIRPQYGKLVLVAKQHNVVSMEAMWIRYLPATKYLKEELLPKISQVKRVYADFSFPIVSPDLPHSARFLDERAGAGSLLDQGVYALTWAGLALNCHGDDSTTMEMVQCRSMTAPGVPGEVDDINTMIFSKGRKIPKCRRRSLS